MTEGTIDFIGHEAWHRTVGERSDAKIPVLCLH